MPLPLPILTTRTAYVAEMPRPVESSGLLALTGVRYLDTAGALEIDRRRVAPGVAPDLFRLAAGQPVSASFRSVGKKDKTTAADLATINGGNHSSVELTAEDVYVKQIWSVNDLRIRRGLRFDVKALTKLATDYADGRSLLLDHRTEERIGRTFAAEVRADTVQGVAANWAVVRAYVVRHERTEWPIRQMDTGLLNFYSIGFLGGVWREELDEDTGRYTYVIFDDPAAGTRLEAVELSAVYHGDTYGASDGRFATDLSDGLAIRSGVAPETGGATLDSDGVDSRGARHDLVLL